jgi:hypothetical protein
MEKLLHYELQAEMMDILYSSDGMMQRIDEIKSRHEVQHQLTYMQGGAVMVHDLKITEQNVSSIKISYLRLRLRQVKRLG